MRIEETESMPAAHLGPMLGVSRQLLVTWAKRDGCPQNKNKTFDLVKVIAWRREHDIAESRGQAETVDADVADQKHEKALLTKAQREIAQIALRKARDEVVDRDEAERALANIIAVARTNLLSVHDRLAVQIAPENPKPAANAIRQALHSVLETMGATKVGAER